jgi:alkaline phosphatase D
MPATTVSPTALFVLLGLTVGFLVCRAGAEIHLGQGMIAGEVTTTTALLQTRLTAVPELRDGAMPGADGVARFLVADNSGFRAPISTTWIRAAEPADFIVRANVRPLRPGTQYFYRVEYGGSESTARYGPVGMFKTPPVATTSAPVKFVVSSCMNYVAFHLGHGGSGGGYQGPDKMLGYPALVPMLALGPDFWVGNGDNVYYDHIKSNPARTAAQMRSKWHEQFAMPRLVQLLARTPAYFLKDDHEYRFNDADATPGLEPSHELGLRMFREQVPIVDPAKPDAVTYRTIRAGRHLQLWFLEGRDYRSSNRLPDGPGKSVWGAEQLGWLKGTLRESNATFKVVISPGPLVGPDSKNKHDNHANVGGFQHEAGELFAWLAANEIRQEQFAVICGDRHWKYHSIHPSGYEEFGTGALNVENAVVGARFAPGAPLSSDPDRRIRQLFVDAEPRGGFLHAAVIPRRDANNRAVLTITLHDDRGNVLHTATKTAETH